MEYFNSPITLVASSFLFACLTAFSAQAQIIGTQLTPALTTAPFEQSPNYSWENYFLDVNNDGLHDLEFWYHAIQSNPYDSHTDAFATVGTRVGSGGGIAYDAISLSSMLNTRIATKFNPGDLIGSNLTFELDNAPLASNDYWHFDQTRYNQGNWVNSKQGGRGLIGFSFTDFIGSLYYGWADIGISPYIEGNLSSYRINIYSYAYESEAYKGIAAGSLASVPLPSAAWLFASSLIGLIKVRRYYKN